MSGGGLTIFTEADEETSSLVSSGAESPNNIEEDTNEGKLDETDFGVHEVVSKFECDSM